MVENLVGELIFYFSVFLLVKIIDGNFKYGENPMMVIKQADSSHIAIEACCRQCGYNIIITQPDTLNFPCCDMWWYCSNKKCKNHDPGTHTIDQGQPSWVVNMKNENNKDYYWYGDEWMELTPDGWKREDR